MGLPTQTSTDFFQWARERKWHEFVDVREKAIEVFPPASSIEGYTVSVGDPTTRRSLSARFIVWKQLERDGVKVEDVEAVTLFFGGDGQHNRDVVLVVRKDEQRVLGVYQIRYGR